MLDKGKAGRDEEAWRASIISNSFSRCEAFSVEEEASAPLFCLGGEELQGAQPRRQAAL